MNKLILIAILSAGSFAHASLIHDQATDAIWKYEDKVHAKGGSYDFCLGQLIDEKDALKGFKGDLPDKITDACAITLIGGGDW